MINTIITCVTGVVTATAGSVISWFLAKKKYNVEVKTLDLEFYTKLADDNTERIKLANAEIISLTEENKKLREELHSQRKEFDERLEAQAKELTLMKNQMLNMYSQVCLNFSCTERNLPVKDITKPKRINKNDKV